MSLESSMCHIFQRNLTRSNVAIQSKDRDCRQNLSIDAKSIRPDANTKSSDGVSSKASLRKAIECSISDLTPFLPKSERKLLDRVSPGIVCEHQARKGRPQLHHLEKRYSRSQLSVATQPSSPVADFKVLVDFLAQERVRSCRDALCLMCVWF